MLQTTVTLPAQPDHDKERLLNILHAHGKQFLSAFDVPDIPRPESETEEEWTGFDSSDNSNSHGTVSDFEDDGYIANSSRIPDVKVFHESTRKQSAANFPTKELRRSFMSSKVSNIRSSSMQLVSKEKAPEKGSDNECTNAQNDALLHRLVHTRLLSGSLNPELDLNHAQKGRALAGRVLELAGEAKLGRGECTFRQEQHNRAAKRIRDGLIRKQRMQEQKTLEEAKNLGNYHPTLKRLYDSNQSSAPKKKRARGLGMGIGKFVGGTLKLSREEIAVATPNSWTRKHLRDHDGPRGLLK